MLRQRIRIVLAITISFFIALYVRETVFVGTTPRLNPLFVSWLENATVTPIPTIIYRIPSSVAEAPAKATPTTLILPSPVPTKKPTPIPTKPPSPTTFPTQSPISISCPSSSNEQYQTISVVSSPTDRPAEQHADLNLQMRGYESTTGVYGLVNVGGDTDDKAPQLSTLISGNTTPKILGLYKIYIWDWSNNSRGPLAPDPEVTLIGLQTNFNQPLVVPQSGYDIGQGYQIMVLYANESTITLKYTREDNIIYGYTLHADRICVDANLLALYREMNSKGRGSLPALRGGQVFGYARGNQVIIAIRDTGTFMDPRVRKDWWKGY